MKISIVGLGWFGAPLALDLAPAHSVLGTTRTQEKVEAFTQKGLKAFTLNPPQTPPKEVMTAEVLVLNIPPFPGQLSWFESWDWNPGTHVIFISSTSVYGQTSGELTERDLPVPDTENGRLLMEEEKWVRRFPGHTIIRFGGLLGGSRHPGKILSGRKGLRDGNWPVDLTPLEDALSFVKLVIDQKIRGETFNLVSPEHPSREEFYQSYCRKRGLPLPEFDSSQGEGKIISSGKCQKFFRFEKCLRDF